MAKFMTSLPPFYGWGSLVLEECDGVLSWIPDFLAPVVNLRGFNMMIFGLSISSLLRVPSSSVLPGEVMKDL